MEWFRAVGLTHLAFHGQKGYNGVAILSQLPVTRVRTKRWCGRPDSRHIYVTLPEGVEVETITVVGEFNDWVRDGWISVLG